MIREYLFCLWCVKVHRVTHGAMSVAPKRCGCGRKLRHRLNAEEVIKIEARGVR